MGKITALMTTVAALLFFSGCAKQPEIPHVKVVAYRHDGNVTISEADFAKCLAVNKQLRECCVSKRNR